MWFAALVMILVDETMADWAYPSVCAPRNTIMLDPNAPVDTKIPQSPVLPDVFQVRVEANMLDKNYTEVAEEYYDFVKKRAVVHLLRNNTMHYIFFDYANNQTIYFIDRSCSVKDLNTDPNNIVFGDTTHNIFSTPTTLSFAKANGLLYKGRKIIRGKKCDWWQSCMFWPRLSSNFTLDYYFSVYNWQSPDLSSQVPVLAEVTGTSFRKDLQQSVPFHHKYEYFDFRHKIWPDDSVFQTPAGIICPGRRQTKNIPLLPEQFTYRAEIVDINNLAVSQYSLFYDHTSKLVQFSYRPPWQHFPFYVQNTMVTEIHDYNTGIAYGIDNVRGNCTIFPLRNTSFDVLTNSNPGHYSLHLKSPNELFYLDNTTYTYEGTRTVRGMLFDVFISNKTDFKLPNYQEFSSTFELSFLNKQWSDAGSVSESVPVQIRIVTPDWVGYRVLYNIYDFTPGDSSEDMSSIASCYADTSKTGFRIAFPGEWDNTLMQYHNLIISKITNMVSKVSHVSPIRVQDRQLVIDSDVFYFIATLLDVPPPLAFYQKLPSHLPQFRSVTTKKASNAADCASYCKDWGILPGCDMFMYCQSRLVCALGTSQASDGAAINNFEPDCAQYVRSTQSQIMDIPLSDAMRILKNDVITGGFRLNINVSEQVTTITADSVDENILRSPQRKLSTRSLMDRFSEQTNKFIPGFSDLVLTGISIDDCAVECLNEMSFVCNSFSYDFSTGFCILSRIHPDERPNVVVNKIVTDLYSKKYTFDYEMVPGTTVLSSSDVYYQNVNSADMCAKLCSVYEEFSCKSFDYCDAISTCYLGRTHFYDIPKADKVHSPICSHFSRQYLSDFRVTTRQHLTNADDRIIKGVSVGQCAKLCVEEERDDCASFGYCGNTTECRLSTTSMRNIGQVSSEANFWCDVYNRQTFPDGTPFTPKSSKCVSPPPSTASISPTLTTPNTKPNTSKTMASSKFSKSVTTSTSGKSETASSSGKSVTTSTSGKSVTTSTSGQIISSQSPYTKKPLKNVNSPPSGKGLSTGGVVGVALAMLVAGIVITALAYLGAKKFKRRLPNDMKIAFAKQEVEIS